MTCYSGFPPRFLNCHGYAWKNILRGIFVCSLTLTTLTTHTHTPQIHLAATLIGLAERLRLPAESVSNRQSEDEPNTDIKICQSTTQRAHTPHTTHLAHRSHKDTHTFTLPLTYATHELNTHKHAH